MRPQFCFRMFDSQKNGSISIEEARVLVFSTATPPLRLFPNPSDSTVLRSGRLAARHFRARWHGRDPASYSAGARVLRCHAVCHLLADVKTQSVCRRYGDGETLTFEQFTRFITKEDLDSKLTIQF